jgi:hypothetical protein
MALDLSEYCLLDSVLRILVFKAISCANSIIWRAKYRNYFVAVDFDNQSIVKRVMINLRYLSFLNVCK